MKKILTPSLFIILYLLFIVPVYALTPATPSAQPTVIDSKTKQLDDLKERLATKVAELRQTQKKAMFGTVKSTSVSTITVETKTSDVKIELTDDIRVFQTIKGKRTGLTTDDVSRDDAVVVFGDYDSNLDLLKAKVIIIQSPLPIRISGTVTESSKKDFTITVATTEGKNYIVDVESTTKNIAWSQEDGPSKGAFSKLVAGDTVYVLGTPEPKKENQISALRILDIGNVSGARPPVTPTSTVVPTEPSEPSGRPAEERTPKPTPTRTP